MEPLGDIEFIELESRAEPGLGPPAGSRRTAIVIGILAVVAAGAVLIAAPRTDDVRSAAATTTTVTSTTTTSAAPTTTTVVADTGDEAIVPGLGPVLGSEVGLEVWFGGDALVSRLDLDSGDLLTLDFRAYPVLATGDHLVLFDAGSAEFVVLDRRRPLDDVRTLTVDGGFVVDAVAPASAPNTVWVADRGEPDSVDWRLVGLEVMAPIASTTTEAVSTFRLPYRVDVAAPPTLDVGDGKILVRRGAGHEPWLDGRLLAHDTSRALVEQCDAQGECRQQWFDIDTGKVLDLPGPTTVLDQTEVLGRWLHTRTRDNTQSVLVEIETGRELDTLQRVTARQFDVAPDGLWGAFTGAQQLRLTDLTTGESINAPGVSQRLGTASAVVLTDRLAIDQRPRQDSNLQSTG